RRPMSFAGVYASAEERQVADVVAALGHGPLAFGKTGVNLPENVRLPVGGHILKRQHEAGVLLFRDLQKALAELTNVDLDRTRIGARRPLDRRPLNDDLVDVLPPPRRELQAVLLHLRRLVLIDVSELFLRAENVAAGHPHLLAVLVEEKELLVLPCRVAERIGAAAALRQPDVPEPVDVAMVQIENGILRGGGDGSHPAARRSEGDMNGRVRSAFQIAAERAEWNLRQAARGRNGRRCQE